MTGFFSTIGAFLLYTAAGLIAVLYLDKIGIIQKWGLPIAGACCLIAFFIFKKSPVNSVGGKLK